MTTKNKSDYGLHVFYAVALKIAHITRIGRLTLRYSFALNEERVLSVHHEDAVHLHRA